MSKLKVNEIEPFSGTGIGVGTSSPHPSAMWEFDSTSKGILPPRMTTVQRNAIPSPAEGLLVYNTDDSRLEEYSNGQWTVSGNGLSPVKNVLRVVKNTVLNAGDFSTLESALASITNNSPSNQYIISIGPGTFVENPIQMKPYVYVIGAGFNSTIIQANNPTEHLIFACDFSSLSECKITGVTLSGKSLLYYASTTGTIVTSFWANHIEFGDSDTLAIADGTIAHSNLYLDSCRYGGVNVFNIGFVARSGSSFAGRISMRNSTTTSKMTAPYPVDMFVADGIGSEINLRSVVARVGVFSGGGNGIRVRNGGTARLSSVDLEGWNKGLWVENVGVAAPFLVGGLLSILNGTKDVQIDHAGTEGGMVFAADDTNKISIIPTATGFGFYILGLEDGDVVVSGKLKQNQVDGTFTDITTLHNNSSPLGLLSSGDINQPLSGLSTLVEAGYGYIQKSDGSIRKIVWPDTSVTFPDNAVSYVYADVNGTIQISSISPSSSQNIIIGRVVAKNGQLIIVEESGNQATHAATEIAEALREGLGPIYVNGGSIASEVGVRNLSVTAGKYFYGERPFLLNGGNPITFSSFYRNGLGGFNIVTPVTQVDAAQWDDGSGTLALLGAGNYAKHSLYALGDSTGDFDSEKYFLVYSQAQYTALTLAEQGNIPTPPPYFTNAVTLIASIIVQQGTTTIVEIKDERPRIGFSASAVAAATFHSGLLGLTVGDDHPQYWRGDGTHVATGDFNLGSHNINNVGTINFPSLTASLPLQLNGLKNVIASAIDLSSSQITNTLANSNLATMAAHTVKANNTALPASPSDVSIGSLTETGSAILTITGGANSVIGNVSIQVSQASGLTSGYLSSTDWNTFNNKQNALTFGNLTDVGTDGITIIGGTGAVIGSGTSISQHVADSAHNGYLSSTDWNTFNNKQPAGNYITALTGEASASGPGSASVTLSNAAVIGKVLTGFVAGPNSTVLATDSILSAIQKLQAQVTSRVFSINANSGTHETGDITLKNGNGITIVDSPAGTFTFDTTIGPNELVVSQGSGLTANYTAGRVRINGTTYSISAGSITVATNATNGRIYVDVDGVVKSTTSTSTPPNAVPLAIFSSSISAITALSENRTLLNVNLLFGSASDIQALTPNLVASAGTTNKYAMADHVHNVPTATATTISSNANAQGTAATFANSDHKHQLTASAALQDHMPQFDGANWQAVYPEAELVSQRAWKKDDEFIATGSGAVVANNGTIGDLSWDVTAVGGASAAQANTAKVDSNHPGVIKITSSGAGGNYVDLQLFNSIVLGGGALVYEFLAQVETLATVTNDYTIRIGMGDLATGADFNNGVYFEYTRATSANWLAKTASGGVRTSTDTGVAVAAGSWVRLTVTVNAAASSISFAINGTAVATITTNIPTTVVGFHMQQIRLAGTPVGFDVDYFKTYQRFTSSR